MCCHCVHASRMDVVVPCLKAVVGIGELWIQWLLQSLVTPQVRRAVNAVHAHHGFNWKALRTTSFILQRPLAQTCPSRWFASGAHTNCLNESFVTFNSRTRQKTLLLCDKSVPQSQSSHSHTAFTNVDSRAQTRKNSAEQEHPCAIPRIVGADILQDEPLGITEAKMCPHKFVVSSDMPCCVSESTLNVLTQMSGTEAIMDLLFGQEHCTAPTGVSAVQTFCHDRGEINPLMLR